MARSLNKVELIGNLTRDPELRYTPQGTAVCTFGLATNRQWVTETGEKKEDVEFHRIVSWQKLAELCAQLLSKGRKVYVEGRLQTRKWTGKDEVERTTTEVVISEMIILDSRGASSADETVDFDIPEDDVSVLDADEEQEKEDKDKNSSKKKSGRSGDMGKTKGNGKSDDTKTKSVKTDEEEDDDIPF